MEPTNPPPPLVANARVAPSPVERQIRSLGTVGMILGILELVSCAYGTLTLFLIAPMFSLERDLLTKLPGQRPPELDKLFATMQQWSHKLALWGVVRLVPFAVASVLLLRITSRLRKGSRGALTDAQTWSIGALAIVGFSLVLQVGVVLPATAEYQRALQAIHATTQTAQMAAFQNTVQGFATNFASFAMVLSAGFMSAWPIALRLISGKLLLASKQPTA